MNVKFALRNFLGKPVQHYLVEEQVLTSPPSKPRVGHHILVVDASGSMCGDIGDVKEKIRKMLTLDEYRDSAMLVSLLSYSSSGDLIEHFSRVSVGDIVKSRSTRAQREIGSLRSRGMTCMTQAFEAALKLARDNSDKDELVAVSLHTDGYFNDPSPSAEFRKIDSLIEDFKKLPNVFVNTIGYRDYCDFKILDKIANALSGKCWRATGIKEFYDSIYDTTALLSGQTAPAIYLEKRGDFDYQVFVSSDGKIVGGAGDLSVNGVAGDATKTVYRYKKVTAKEFEKSGMSETLPGLGSSRAVLAFARAQLAEGRVNAAKYAVVSSRILDLLLKHARALTGGALSAFGADLEHYIFTAPAAIALTEGYGLDSKQATVPRALSILAEHRDDFVLDMEAFTSGYKRRGVKRVVGAWVGDKLVRPGLRSELRDKDQFVAVSGFDFNRCNATINMLVAQPCKLFKIDTGQEVRELGGVKLDLRDYKQYTIVGDGAVNVDELRVRITGKKLHRALVAAGVLDKKSTFDPRGTFSISLSSRPLVEYAATFDASALRGLGERLALLHAADKLFGALLREKTSELSGEQVAELKRHYVTPNFYLSFPTTNPYTDLKKAIADGEIDTRFSYTVCVGSKDFLNPADLYSGNEFLRRRYEVTSKACPDAKKATLAVRFDADFKVAHKKLSARTTLGPVDAVMTRVFDEFFGIADTGAFKSIFDVELAGKLGKVLKKKKIGRDEAVEVLEEARRAAGAALDRVYSEVVSPLVFYIGSSGLIPDDFGDVVALTPEQLVAKYPSAELSKSMKTDGAFYDLGNGVIITVVTEPTYFSTERGVEVANELAQAS